MFSPVTGLIILISVIHIYSNMPPCYSKPLLQSQPSLKYSNKPFLNGSEIIFTARIPYHLTFQWYKNAGNVTEKYSSILSSFLTDNYKLTLNTENNRLSDRLRRECSRISKLIQRKKGMSRQLFVKKYFTLNICQSDLISGCVLQEKLVTTNEKLVTATGHTTELQADLLRAEDKISDMQNKIKNLHLEILKAKFERDVLEGNLTDEKENSKVLLQTNEQMKHYIENLCGISVGLNHRDNKKSSSNFAGVSRRYQLKLLREIKSRAECALWFLDLFELKLDSISLIDSSSVQHGIDYISLTNNDHDKLERVLQILDRFYVSDACYSELSTICDGLPKVYLIKQLRSDMNNICHIQRTPGCTEGAEINVRNEVTFAIKSYLERHPTLREISDKISFSLKFSGDGTNVSRNAGMVVMSFALFSPQSDNLECYQHHTIAVVRAHESYELYKTSFANVFKSIHGLYECGCITVDGEDFPVNVFVSGDYKFLLTVLGMGAATSNHACIYCKIHKKDRWDMSHGDHFYNVIPMVRSEEYYKHKNPYGCVHKSLVNLPLDHIVVDELHLMLRVTDRLLENLIQEVKDLDIQKRQRAGLKAASGEHSHVNMLVQAIKDCGVSFKIWEVKDKNGKTTGSLEFSSLMGAEKKTLLKKLPNILANSDILNPNSQTVVIDVWKYFSKLYTAISSSFQTNSDVKNANLFLLARDWVKLFVSLEGQIKGYERERITPYIHILVYHIPHLAQVHIGIKQFTAQGMEKLNDIIKANHKQHSNRVEACASVVKTTWRQSHLAGHKRAARPYLKKDDQYWSREIFEKRKRHV